MDEFLISAAVLPANKITEDRESGKPRDSLLAFFQFGTYDEIRS